MADITINLQTDNGQCLYEQIYEHIKNEIKKGKLLVGEKLPSTRLLAEYLLVARSTVDYAYAQLVSEGYIEASPYRGYYVLSPDDVWQLDIEGKNNLADLKGHMVENTTYDEDHIKEDRKYDYDFSPYGVDMSLFPFEIWKKITKNILNYGNAELFSQGAPQGDLDLRTIICRYLHSSRGVNCVPAQIVVGAGTDYLLMLLEKIFNKKMVVAMENPTYAKIYRIFSSFGYEIKKFELSKGGFLPEKLVENEVEVVYTMPSHQFPTGKVMSIGKRNELLLWAAMKEGRYIIEDDYDSEFRYKGKPIPSLQASDIYEKVIYMGTFSKAIAPAIRISYMVLPKELINRYYNVGQYFSCTVSRIDQKILAEFIKEGYFERYLNKMRKRYKFKHDILMEELKSFEDRFLITGDNAGLHVLMTAKYDTSEDELIKKAAEHGIKVYGMSDSLFGSDNNPPTILIGFGSLSEDKIKEGLSKLNDIYR